jgi:hypothetical protein
MLRPTLDAANAAFKQRGKTFNFGMGGEQASVCYTRACQMSSNNSVVAAAVAAAVATAIAAGSLLSRGWQRQM